MRTRLIAVAAALASFAAACSSGGSPDSSGRVRIVTTVSPITNIVAWVGGERVSVTGIVPEGTNSHTFEPRPSDARLVAEADVIFVNGLGLEEPTLELAEPNRKEGTEIVKLADRTIDRSEWIFDFSFPESGGDPNPHLWTNPPYAKRFAQIVRDTLTTLDPEGVALYDRNYLSFAERIDELDTAVRAATLSVPEKNRKLLTYHDSFPYFAREYGWTIVGAVQPSDFSEPTPREVSRLIQQIRDEGVPAIFGSEVFPSPVLEQIARESGATYVAELRDDDLPGSKGDPAHSYFGLMVFDFKTFMKALGGDVTVFDTIDTANPDDESNVTYRE
ncbi:MAG TPA: metal ABC transporter substrate-binding protein [Actinomycetota bacterium]|nr:metal ABC transporter substrate-binding protein [Actinomycetota bacterium]